jgi:hypothetical protein
VISSSAITTSVLSLSQERKEDHGSRKGRSEGERRKQLRE